MRKFLRHVAYLAQWWDLTENLRIVESLFAFSGRLARIINSYTINSQSREYAQQFLLVKFAYLFLFAHFIFSQKV